MKDDSMKIEQRLQNMKNFFIRVRLFDRLHFFWAKRITSFAGKLPSYALAKSCERSELTTYQVTVMRKFEIEDNIPVCGGEQDAGEGYSMRLEMPAGARPFQGLFKSPA